MLRTFALASLISLASQGNAEPNIGNSSRITGGTIDSDALMFCNGTRDHIRLSAWSVGLGHGGIYTTGEGDYSVRPASCRYVGKANSEIHVALWRSGDLEAPITDLPDFQSKAHGPEIMCFPTKGPMGASVYSVDNYEAYPSTPPCEAGFEAKRVSFHAYLMEGEGEEIAIGDYTQAQYEADMIRQAEALIAANNSEPQTGYHKRQQELCDRETSSGGFYETVGPCY